jgi:hypothetical protein
LPDRGAVALLGFGLFPSRFALAQAPVQAEYQGLSPVVHFDPATGAFLGQLADGFGHAISIEGLWGLHSATTATRIHCILPPRSQDLTTSKITAFSAVFSLREDAGPRQFS